MVESREAGELDAITFTGAALPALPPLTDEDRKRLAKTTVLGSATLLRSGSFLAQERIANLPPLAKAPADTVGRRHRARAGAARARSRRSGAMEVAQVNLPVGLLIWVMIIPMLVKVDFGALHQVKRALARHRRDAVRQLGWSSRSRWRSWRWLFIRHAVRAAAARRAARQLHRRPDPARRRALHGDGVRLEPADRRRSAVHAVAGGAERHHHGLRLRADRRRCCSASRRITRALGHAAHLGGALHRDPGDPRAALAQGAAARRAGRHSMRRWRRSARGRSPRCCSRWCCCSRSRARRSSSSRWSSRCWRCRS